MQWTSSCKGTLLLPLLLQLLLKAVYWGLAEFFRQILAVGLAAHTADCEVAQGGQAELSEPDFVHDDMKSGQLIDAPMLAELGQSCRHRFQYSVRCGSCSNCHDCSSVSMQCLQVCNS